MAHELFIEEGKPALFYVGGAPWHGLGTHMEEPPSSAAEAIAAAGLDWEVAKVPLYISGTGRLIPMPDNFAVVRKDHLDRADCPVFGFVGAKYEPLQNLDAFRFFDPLLQDGAVTFETAGGLGRGERVWVLARLTGDVRVGPDELQRYLLLANRHDGRGSVVVKFTPTRVVCKNTLSAAFSDEGRSFRVKHDGKLRERLLETRTLLDLIINTYEQLRLAFESMRTFVLHQPALDAYLKGVFPDPQKPTNIEAARKADRDRTAAAYFYQHGKGNQHGDVRGTLWAAYNGVTDYIDHRKPNLKANDFSEARLQYVWFGSGAATKQRALVHALQLADPERLETLALQ